MSSISLGLLYCLSTISYSLQSGGSHIFSNIFPSTFPTHPPNHSPIKQPLVSSLYDSVSVLLVHIFCILESTYKGNNLAFVLLIISLSIIPLGPSKLLQMARYQSFLSLKHSSLYPCNISSLSIHPLVGT